MTAEHPVTAAGELPSAQAAEVQAHVIACDSCRRVSAELRSISRDLGRWEIEDAPETLTAPAMPRAAESGAVLPPWVRWRPAFVVSLTGVGVVAALVAGSYTTMSPKPALVTAPMVRASEQAGRSPYGGGREAGASQSPAPPERLTEGMKSSLDYPSRLSTSGAPIARPGEQAAQSPVPDGPSIARTAGLRLTTTDFDKTRSGVERTVAQMGGWFRQLDVSGSQGQARALTASVMAPASRLDDLMSAIKALGAAVEESKQAEDVSEQIVDVQARLSNARNTERRLLDLLQQRTGKLREVLEAEQQIGRVREEIERLDAQRQNLRRRVDYARLSLDVHEELQPRIDLGPKPVASLFNDAFQRGLSDGLSSFLDFALFVAGLAPVLLVWSVVLVVPVFLLVRDHRRRKPRRPAGD